MGIGGSWFVVVGVDGWPVEVEMETETEAKLGLFCVKLVRCRGQAAVPLVVLALELGRKEVGSVGNCSHVDVYGRGCPCILTLSRT